MIYVVDGQDGFTPDMLRGPNDDTIYVTSPTGGRKGSKLARYDLIPVGPLKALAEQYGRGAFKYGDDNWNLGYPWSLSYASAMRHLNAFWDGEDWDDDPAMPGHAHHLDAAMFHIMALREFVTKHPAYDDRPTTLEASRKEKASASAAIKAAFGEQTEDDGRVSPVQASRWEIP